MMSRILGEIEEGVPFSVAVLPEISKTGKPARPFLSAEGVIMSAKTADKKAAPKVTFQDHILPIFRAKCGSCHNANDRKQCIQKVSNVPARNLVGGLSYHGGYCSRSSGGYSPMERYCPGGSVYRRYCLR